MIVDVSEIKAFRHCKRQWQLSSRNSFHLTASIPPKAFHIGTVFHECLHRLYLGKDLDFVSQYCKEMMEGCDPKDTAMLLSMVKGYATNVIPSDLEHLVVMDIEWHFKYSIMDLLDEEGKRLAHKMGLDTQLSDTQIAGSIDMITLDLDTGEIWGFEHKTAKSFRNDTYLWMDEQPRLYYAALQQWVKEYNSRHNSDQPVTLGGCYINEVRKLVRAFDTKRRALTYPEDDLRNFLLSFAMSCAECHKMVENPDIPRLPTPDMMACMNCMYNTICQNVQYQNLTEERVLKEFGADYQKRDTDHLNEKVEIDNAGATQQKEQHDTLAD